MLVMAVIHLIYTLQLYGCSRMTTVQNEYGMEGEHNVQPRRRLALVKAAE